MSEPPVLLRADDAPRWLLLFIALLLVMSIVGLFVWLQVTGRAASVIGRPATLGREPVITELSEIFAEDFEANLRGRMVALDSAPVEDVVGDSTFFIGGGEGQRLPVILLGEVKQRQPEHVTVVRAGERARIYGVLRSIDELSAFDEDDLLETRHRDALQRHELFISALRVESE